MLPLLLELPPLIAAVGLGGAGAALKIRAYRRKPDYAEIDRLERALGIVQEAAVEQVSEAAKRYGEVRRELPALQAVHNLIIEPDGVLRLKTPEELRPRFYAQSAYSTVMEKRDIEHMGAHPRKVLGADGEPIRFHD